MSSSAARRCAVGERIEASALVVGRDDEVQRRLQRCVATLQRMVCLLYTSDAADE